MWPTYSMPRILINAPHKWMRNEMKMNCAWKCGISPSHAKKRQRRMSSRVEGNEVRWSSGKISLAFNQGGGCPVSQRNESVFQSFPHQSWQKTHQSLITSRYEIKSSKFARPKSASFKTSVSVWINIFVGLISMCVTRCLCISWTAWTTTWRMKKG